MRFRLVRGKWHLAAAFVVAHALAFGYYAGAPDDLGASVDASLSGAGSVHSRYLPKEADGVGKTRIAHEASHLFAAPHRGPRADRYMKLTRSTPGEDPAKNPGSKPEQPRETKIAKAPVKADMMATGSIPREDAEQAGAPRARTTPLQNARPRFGLMPRIPVSERSTASLFLSALSPEESTGFPELKDEAEESPDEKNAAQDKVNVGRGLKFAGETEQEYQTRQRRCLATAIYFEARGESEKGQLAVAQVVMNRVRSSLYPDTICGVVFQGQWRRTGCQFSFACDGRSDIPKDKEKWRQANELAKRVTDGESWLGDIGHATHYHANYVSPRWRWGLNKIKKVGRHIFYRVKGEQIEDALTGENPDRGLALAGSG